MGQLCQFFVVLVASVLLVLATAATTEAQTVEISPFYGYRVGGSISQVTAGPVVDDDGGPSFGAIVDVVYGPPPTASSSKRSTATRRPGSQSARATSIRRPTSTPRWIR